MRLAASTGAARATEPRSAFRGRREVVPSEDAPPQRRPRRSRRHSRRLDRHGGQAQREVRAETENGRSAGCQRRTDPATVRYQALEALEAHAGVGDPRAERIALARRVERGDRVEEVGEAPLVLLMQRFEEPFGADPGGTPATASQSGRAASPPGRTMRPSWMRRLRPKPAKTAASSAYSRASADRVEAK